MSQTYEINHDDCVGCGVCELPSEGRIKVRNEKAWLVDYGGILTTIANFGTEAASVMDAAIDVCPLTAIKVIG